MAELRPHYIDVDLKKNTQYNVPVVTQNDTATHFIIRVTDDGLSGPELLDAYQEITMTSQRPDGESFYLTGTRIPGTNEIEFHLGTDETAFSGSVLASLQFYLVEDASRYTSAQFRYDVKKDLTKNYTPTQREETLVEVVLRDGPVAIQEAKDAKIAVDGALVELEQDKTAAIERLDEVTEENKTIFREPVATFAALSTTYPNPEHGTTVRVTSEAASYRYSDGTWVKTDEYNPTAIDQVTAQLAETTEEIEMKNTFHASKAFAKLKRGEPATIVFLGDSTTEQNATTNGQPNHVGLLTTYLQNAYPSLVTVVNAGISGHNITMMLERLQKDVLVHNPDLVIVCSGINDQGGTFKITLDEFKKNYDLLIQEIISQSTTDVILRTTNVVMSAATSSAIDLYNEVTRSLAIKYDLGLFDLYKEMQEDIAAGEISVTTVGPFLNDSVHPNENGHQYIYENLKSFFIPKKAIHKPVNTRKMISAKGGFRHVGGTEFAGANYVNGYVLLFNQPNKRISFEYEGEDFTIIYGATTGTGQFKVFVDGEQQGDVVDTYSPTVKYRESVSYRVPPGKHFVEIECQPTKNANSSSTNLQIQAVIYKKEGRINEGLIPLPYSYLDVRATANIALTDGVEKTFVFNSVPFNIGDIASYVLATGEIMFKKAGLYQIYFSNRFVTEPDKSLEVNYKVNSATVKRAYARTPNSTTALTPSLSLDLTDIRVLNVGDKLTFGMNAQGSAPSNTAYAVIVKIG